MKTILKTYEVSYIYGTINPEERKIKISTVNQLTEEFIKSEIERMKPHQKGFIGSILSTLLIEEKVIAEEKEEIKEEKREIPVFNW